MIENIDKADIRILLDEAAASPRLRSHRLLHDGPDDATQRLVIAAAKGTYIRPHIHREQWEMLILLSGSGSVLQFSPSGEIEHVFDMRCDATNIVQIPQGMYHGFVVTGDDAVVMEVKQGPYRPNEFASWAPEEESKGVTDFMARTLRAP